jgi:hypothetical protein
MAGTSAGHGLSSLARSAARGAAVNLFAAVAAPFLAGCSDSAAAERAGVRTLPRAVGWALEPRSRVGRTEHGSPRPSDDDERRIGPAPGRPEPPGERRGRAAW